ncbi:MAG: hypothetical protein A2939_04895 [Parcubacteria group bacterium RIFCSPLOWO2_01_FULL_48_18]|nr:MAG: hypothetical protein A2939_04895 [Parcubacteria group bacterium RIFCSPLOWO2_01_FULL_48_18]
MYRGDDGPSIALGTFGPSAALGASSSTVFGASHVEALTASVRSLDHLLYATQLGSDIATAPFKILKEWSERGLPMPDKGFRYKPDNLAPIEYRDTDLKKPWHEFGIHHELTDKGIERFSSDWNALIR